jgi:hypothetical protein
LVISASREVLPETYRLYWQVWVMWFQFVPGGQSASGLPWWAGAAPAKWADAPADRMAAAMISGARTRRQRARMTFPFEDLKQG